MYEIKSNEGDNITELIIGKFRRSFSSVKTRKKSSEEYFSYTCSASIYNGARILGILWQYLIGIKHIMKFCVLRQKKTECALVNNNEKIKENIYLKIDNLIGVR